MMAVLKRRRLRKRLKFSGEAAMPRARIVIAVPLIALAIALPNAVAQAREKASGYGT